jgi:metallo-beta-lactamase family protein
MKLTFYGGVGEVTGSRHLLEADGARILLDCGMFQGHRGDSVEKNKNIPFDVKSLNGVILSHAHIDHSGGLPILAKNGLSVPIHATRTTVDLCGIMLPDSARLQEEDANFFNKIHQKDGQQIEPLYIEKDALNALSAFKPHEYGETFSIGPAKITLLNAGHVLGSAMIQVDVGGKRILFTGDLGRRDTILMATPQIPEKVDYLMIESTYGDRMHDPIAGVEKKLIDVVQRACAEKGKIIIPSFALERTQEIVFIFEKLIRHKQIPAIPLYVDSPMAVNVSEIFNRNLDSFSFTPEFHEYVKSEGDPFGFDSVKYVRTGEESKRLNDLPGPMVILSASGMMEGGRVLHHLRNNIENESTTILIVGYQAQGTLGRRLLDGAKKVRIFGLEHPVLAQVDCIHALSSHADKGDLLWFIQGLKPAPKKVFLVHGEEEDRQALAQHLKDVGVPQTARPEFGESFPLD